MLGGWFQYSKDWENEFHKKNILPLFYEEMKQVNKIKFHYTFFVDRCYFFFLFVISNSACIWSIYLSVDTIFQDFLDRGLLLTSKLLNQGFLLVKLKSSLRKFYGRHH